MHRLFPAVEVKHHLQREKCVALMGLAQIRCFCLLIFNARGELTKPAQLPGWACGQVCKINYGHLKSNSVLYATLSPPRLPFLKTSGWIPSLSLFAPARPGHFMCHLPSGSALQWIKNTQNKKKPNEKHLQKAIHFGNSLPQVPSTPINQ